MTAAPPLDWVSAISSLALVAIIAAAAARRIWIAPAAVAATAPFAWYHTLGPTEITVSKAALVGAVIGAAIHWSRNAERRAEAAEVFRSHRALWLLAAFALLSAASAAWAIDGSDAVRDALKWAWYAAAFALAAACTYRREDAEPVAWTICATSIVVAAVGVWQATTSAPSSFSDSGAVIARLTATLEGPNQFGAYLETVIPCLAALAIFGELSWGMLAGAGVLLGALIAELLLAYSRGALWSCAIALLFLCAMALARARPDFRCPARRAALTLAIAALVVVPVAVTRMSGAGWQHEFWTAGLHDPSDSLQRRRELWACAATVFRAHPVVGVGAGNFADALASCHPRVPAEKSNANNWYLETAADLGIVGLVLLGGFLVVRLTTAGLTGAASDAVLLGGYAAVIAFVLHGFVDDVMPYPKAALTFFVLAATLTGAGQGTVRRRP